MRLVREKSQNREIRKNRKGKIWKADRLAQKPPTQMANNEHLPLIPQDDQGGSMRGLGLTVTAR